MKGKILPEYRNIYCASGVIHLVDSVLGVPSMSAYQQISQTPELSTFRSLIDRSSTYRSLLDQVAPQNWFSGQNQYPPRQSRLGGNETTTGLPRVRRQYTSTNNYMYSSQPYGYNSNVRKVTILAPSDFALAGIKDGLLQNQTGIDLVRV